MEVKNTTSYWFIISSSRSSSMIYPLLEIHSNFKI
jgi:hypothetical protein